MGREITLLNKTITLLILFLATLHMVNYFFPQEYSRFFTTWWMLAILIVLLISVAVNVKLSKVLLQIGMLLLVSGMMYSALFRSEGVARVEVGQAISGQEGDYQWLNRGILTKQGKAPFIIGVQAIVPKDSQSTIVLLDSKGKVQRKEKLSIAKSAVLEGYKLSMSDAGYLPAIMIYKQGKDIYNNYAMTTRVDKGEYLGAFDVSGEKWRATVKFRTLELNSPENKGLESPVTSMVNLTIKDGNKEIFNAPVLFGNIAKKEDVTVEYNDVRTWAQYRIVKDFGARLVLVGAVCTLGSLLSTLFKAVRRLR